MLVIFSWIRTQFIFTKSQHKINFTSFLPLKIIKEFEKLPFESYEKKRPKNEPTDSYFYLARHLAKFMMRSGDFTLHVYPVRTEMTALSSHVCCTYDDESKHIIVHKTLLQILSTDEDKSKHSIVNKTLLQNCSTDEDKLRSAEEGK